MERVIELAERGWVPDPLLRAGIRRLLRNRLRQIEADSGDASPRVASLVRAMSASPIALDVQKANEQHYEVPASFFERVLGPHLKYSCCYWPEGIGLLGEAEEAMLQLTCHRAGLEDEMRILELGCGWGSLSLWMARQYPHAQIVSVSNSHGQRCFIQDRAVARGLDNLEVLTADMNDFSTDGRFDRIVSVEMFEHMRNYRELLGRIAGWLEPHGNLFIHVFCHRSHPYLFETDGRGDWMARHFFTGGLMPSPALVGMFSEELVIERQWEVNGRHYEKTALAWLEQLDDSRAECLEVLTDVYGVAEANRWLQRWRMFFLACAELFAYRGGGEWFVSHSLLRYRPAGEVA